MLLFLVLPSIAAEPGNRRRARDSASRAPQTHTLRAPSSLSFRSAPYFRGRKLVDRQRRLEIEVELQERLRLPVPCPIHAPCVLNGGGNT